MKFKIVAQREELVRKAEVVAQRYYQTMRAEVDSIELLRMLPLDVATEIAAKNRVMNTDPYNLTMASIKGEDWKLSETYVMSCRKSPWGKLIFSGADLLLQSLFGSPITRAEYLLAKEIATQQGQIFPDEMWKFILEENAGFIPIDIDMPPLGTVLLPHEPMFRVSGSGELCAHFEPALIPIFYSSLVATHFYQLNDQGKSPFFLQSLRSSINPLHDIQTNYAALPAGHNWASNNAAASLFEDIRSSGTVAHRLMSFYFAIFMEKGIADPELETYRLIARKMSRPMFLVDLVSTISSGLPKAIIAIKESIASGKPEEYHTIRIDSGEMLELCPEVMDYLAVAGLDKVRVAIAESVSVESKSAIRGKVSAIGYDPKRVGFGAGGAVAWYKKSRDDGSAVFKSVMANGIPTVKLSDDIGKTSLAGNPEIFRNLNANRGPQSIIGQVGDSIPGYQPIMVPAIRQGRYVYSESNSDQIVLQRVKDQWAKLTQHKRVIHHTTKALARMFVQATAPEEVLAAFDRDY